MIYPNKTPNPNNTHYFMSKHVQLTILFLTIFFVFATSAIAETRVDSLLQQLENSNTQDELVLSQLYHQIGKAYFREEKNDAALEYLEKAWAIQENKPETRERHELIFNLGHIYQRLSQYQESLELFFKYINSGHDFHLPKKKAEALSRIASIYQSLGDYERSYDYHLKALGLVEALHDTLGMAKGYYEIGTIFFYQENYQAALEKYQKAKYFFSEKENVRGVYAALAAMGTTYEKQGRLKESLEHNLRSLELAEQEEYLTGIAYAMGNIAANYRDSEQYGAAKEFYARSLALKKASNDIWGQIGTYIGMAETGIASGEYENAVTVLDTALHLANEIGSRPRVIEILELYSEVYDKQGDYQSSNQFLKEYIELKDSVLNETTLREMGQRQTRYEVQQREKQILLLKNENKLLEKEKEIDTLYNYIFFATALFLGLMLVMVVGRFRAQKENNALLEEKNKEINQTNDELQRVNDLVIESNQLLEEKNDQIKTQNKRLEDSNEDLRNFASVASHDLKEPLRMINAYTNILNKRYNQLFDENAQEFMGYIIDAVSRMEGLLNGLLDYSRVSTAQEQKKIISTRDIVDLVQGNLKFPILQNEATINVDYDQLPRIAGNQTQMVQLFQNLISNAIKFKGDRKPVIDVKCTRQKNFHLFTISDNGIGIKEEYREKIFEMFRRLHTKEEYEGTGIGLATCKKIVDRHGGRLWVESEEGEGSTFFFTLPIVKEMEMESVSV